MIGRKGGVRIKKKMTGHQKVPERGGKEHLRSVRVPIAERRTTSFLQNEAHRAQGEHPRPRQKATQSDSGASLIRTQEICR